MPQHGVFLFLFIGGVSGANRTVPDPAYLHQNKNTDASHRCFVLRYVKSIKPPAVHSTALVFRCTDGQYALSSAKNTVQIPPIGGVGGTNRTAQIPPIGGVSEANRTVPDPAYLHQ